MTGAPPDFTSSYRLTSGGTVTLAAWRGTEAVGHLTGIPLELTDFGSVTLTVEDANGETVKLVLSSMGQARDITQLIRLAAEVGDSRNTAADASQLKV